MTTDEIPRGIGDNNPPPHAEHAARVAELKAEAEAWLTGSAITTQEQADTVAGLAGLAQQEWKAADDARKAEKQPHLNASKMVDAEWKPILADAERVKVIAKQALTPWLAEQDRMKRERAEQARRDAEELAERARQEMAASAGDLEARETAEEATRVAKEAERTAAAMRKDRARLEGGKRGIGLRTRYIVHVEDATAAAKWAWQTHRAEIDALVAELAQRAVTAASGNIAVPGVRIEKKREAV